MKKRMSKVLSLVLLLGMLLSLVPAAAFAAEDTTSWQKVELADITADDTVAITMTTSAGVTYALSNTAVTKNPAAPEVSVSGTTLTANDDSLISWSVQSVDGGYTFTSGNNTLNYSDIKTAQSVRISTDAAAVWSLDENGEYLTTTSGNTTHYLGVFISASGAGSWRHYAKGASNIANEVVSFWKLSDSAPEEPTKAAKPTAIPAAGEVEAGTEVTFSCATEGATIMISYDEEIWFEETSITVTEDVTVYVKAVKEGLEDSDVAVFAYTLKAETPEPATTAFVPVESPEEGDKVVIYYPAGGKVVGTEEYYYNNIKYELVAVDATLAEGKLNVPEGAAILTVSVDESGSLSFKTEDGKYLFMDGTHVKFVEEAGDYTLFALEETTSTNYSGHFIKSVNAKHNDKAQYVEYYGGYFTVYGMNADKADIYTFQFFKEETDTPEPATVAKPTADPAGGEVKAGTEVTFSCETAGAVISYSTDNGATWTEGSSYTVNEGVTILVKATLGDAESEVATFTYTIKAVQPEPETVPISTALAGSDKESFTVKGVVTLLDGKNIYVQDATGGICLRLSTNPSGVALGDTVIFTGAKSVYNGLPQLNGTTFDKSEGLTLEAKDTTIAALTTADVCTYVHLSGLKVTEVYDNNGAYSNPNITLEDSEGKSIQIYKAVVGKSGDAWALAVGDIIDFNGAVGIFVKDDTATLQLRNTLTSEITVTDAAVRTPTANPAGGAVAKDTVVTFSCETAGAVISYSTDNGETWTEGSSFTVTEDVTIQVKAVLGDKESAVAEFTYTVKTVAPTMLDKLTEAPADGSRVVIHYPAGNMAMTSTDNSGKLTGIASEPAEGRLELADAMAFMTVHVTENVYTFELDGKYLTSGATGNSLSFADAESDYSKWTLQQQTDGSWYIVNVNAVYNDTQQAIEYYKGAFTTFGVKANNPAYKFDFYGAAASSYGLVTDLAQLTDGAYVVIYNQGHSLAMTSETYNNWYLLGAAASVADGQVAEPAANQVWKVTVNEDGSYTFTQDAFTVAAWLSGNYVELTNNASYNNATSNTWNLDVCNAETGTFYMRSSNLTTSNGGAYIEAYYKKQVSGDTFCGYSTSTEKLNEKDYGMQFYLVPKPEAEEPTGETYGLTSKLADGDKVILFNAANNVALGNTIASHKVSGVSLTPVEGVITTDNTAVVWTVKVNADGTYTFTQGDNTLGGAVSGSYNNLVLTEATYTGWTLTGPDSSDFNYFLSLNDMATNFGKIYLEYYNGFTLYGSTAPDKAAFGITFYKQGAEPETPNPGETGDLVTSLDQLTDGTTVAIYSPGHKTAISTKPNGDWYLKANAATLENGKVVNFTADYVWTVKKNDNGTYSFYAYGDETRSITVWASGTYAELSLNVATYPENTWTLTPAKTANCYYFSSPTVSGERGAAYIEAYVRNEFEVFSGYFTSTTSNKFTESEFALQFYLIDPEDAIEAYDDGEWDGVLEKGGQYVAYNDTAKSAIGLFAEANYSMKAVPTTIVDGKAHAGNGAYAFTVDTMGRYYSFEVNGKYLATNNDEELFFAEPNEDGSIPETAKWFLTQKDAGYILYNKEASYNGTPVCIEYYSSVFSGWTFSTKNDVGIYLFNFYKTADGTEIRDGIVQDPAVIFDCDSSRYIEQDYVCSFSLDDLAEEITNIAISFTAGERTVDITEYDVSSDGKSYSFTIPAKDIDGDETLTSFSVNVKVTNSYDIEYSGEKIVEILDEPFFTELTPAPNSQTRDEKKPVISAKVGNVGQAPVFTMTVNDKPVEATFENGVLSYTPAEDLTDGRVTVKITVERADGVKAEKTWNFTVGIADYQLYFGQLHSHTTYSDGSGSLDTALEYIASLPESANVQFVAFTDHSNYFDTTSAANPADALNDKSLMTDASRALWDEYKGKVAAFNETHDDLIALAGYEMTWSGGPGHINTFDSDGLVSRNNAELNNKTNDAGMKLYYETLKQGNSLSQFNHPGTTFGNFTDFSYWDEATDAHMFLVEVGNGEGQIGAGGYYPSYEQYIIALDKGWHVAPTNNQDNHKGRWGNANDARDVILTNDFSEQGIYGAIRALRVYATEDKNLQVNYTINDEPMGTIFTDENAPEKLDIAVTLYDPDTSDSVSKVELVVDGGVTAYTWDNAAELAEGQLTAELDPEYSYYFIRVTQKDGDLAVTAPIWVGNAVKLGITDIKAEAETVYKDEKATLVTTLYNNEEAEATVKSLTYTINGSEVIGTDSTGYKISAGGTLSVDFKHTFTTAKLTTVTVTAIIELDGKDYTYTANVELDILDREAEGKVTPIADVRAASDPNDTGYRFTIEGVVTSNASGYDKDTAFFDCIYVQDETGGICCFPVSGNYKIGDKVRIVGHTDFYQGEPELQVKTIEVIGEGGTVEPAEITASQLNDRSAEGKLVTVKGTVESFEVENGRIQTIMVKDAEGNLARVFIDGYITTGKEVENCEVGAQIVVTGLASYDDTWPDTNYLSRIRIRDRADVVCTPAEPFTISETDITIPAQSTYQLTTKGAASVVWTSDNEKVATVDYSGLVTAHLYGTAVISVTDGETTLQCTVHVLFSDVTDSAKYYYKPVYWAAENNITVGYNSGEHIGQFGVGLNCERRQLMIFLWRFAGRPGQGASVSEYGDAREMFNDLSKYSASSDTNQAIAWAYKTGITKGYPDGGFHPTAPIVRKDVMIMLYRLAGKPDVTGTLTWPDCKDYKPTSDTYKAILWGSQNGITNGYSQGEYAGTFGATVDCLREQIVTFLYRYNNVKNANAGTSAWKEGARGPFEQNAQTGSALKTNAAAAVATPTADVQEGEVPYGTEVNLRCATEGAEILYSTDGGMNFTEGTSLTLTRTVGVYVIAEKNGLMSEPDVLTYSVQPATPTADVPSGEVEKGTVVTFSCESEGAEISYSTDGGKTWKQEDTYTINEDVTILVMATLADVDSEKAEFTYTVKTEDPTPVPDPLHIILDANGGKVSITRLRLGANGSVPALPVPQEREGYIFGGWFDAAEGGNEVVQGDILTESTTLFAHWYELRAVVTNNAVVPEALKSRYATSDAMKTAMLNTVKRRLGTTSVKGNQLYEISVEYYDGSDWLPITADQFPTKGVKVSLTIPSGSAATDRFVALHLFGEDCNGHKAGEGEMPTVTKSGNTLSFTVHGTSPLLLVWTGSGSNNGGTNGTTPKTGDEANLGLWIALMAASSAALAALVIGQKKRKNRA